jgi:hypothetical protein
MSELKEALEQLDYWLFDNYPDLFESLSPGLTTEDIQEECESRLIEISEEIRDFYCWKNGANRIFYSTYHGEELAVLPFYKAIDFTIDMTGGGYVTRLLESKQIDIDSVFFMFRDFEDWIHFVDCRDRNTSPVLILSDDDHIRLTHTSLTSMVLTTLECYEAEVLTFNNLGYVHVNNMEDYRTIFAKYNANQDDIRKRYGNLIDIYLEELS